MYKMEDILTMLQEGQKPEDIANSFAAVLNSAIQEQKKIDSAAEREANKLADFTVVVDTAIAFIEDYYPELITDNVFYTNEDLKELLKEFDTMVPELIKLGDVIKQLESALAEEPTVKTFEKPEVKVRVKPARSADSVFDKFFKMHGLA